VDLVIILLYLASLLIIWQFVGYPLLMAIIALRSKPKLKDYTFQPEVSILVPTFNEENSIKQKLENLIGLDYPPEKFEIIIVDSGSRDKTVQIANDIIKAHAQKNPSITIVKETERKGKASAINFGKSFARHDIILVTDANCTFNKEALKEMMPHFKDADVGAVGGQFSVSNANNDITTSSQFYWELEYIMRIGESALDSSCLLHGDMNAWRKELVTADTSIVSEDLDTVIQIRRKGYKIVYTPKAIFYEGSPSTVKDWIKQRKKNTIGTIKNIFKYWQYFVFPRDYYSLIIFPSHKTLAILSPFLLAVVPVLYAISLAVSGISVALAVHAIVSAIIFGILFVVLLSLKSQFFKSTNHTRFSLLSVPKILFYVLLNEYLVTLAWKDFLFGKYSVLWEKAETTR